MRQVFVNTLIIGVLASIWFYLSSTYTFSITPTSVPEPTATATPTPTQAPPATLLIPKLSLASEIEFLDIGENRQISAPSAWNRAGWYMGGAKPGEIGTAIISGHYDDQFGQPALFYNIKLLEVGDEIVVVDQTGRNLTFQITQKSEYPNNSVIEEFVRDDGEANLILITCAGWWNRQAHNYSRRLVVYTKMEGK